MPARARSASSMRVVTSAQITELDRRATEQHGIPVTTLMDNAGRRVAQAARELLRTYPGPVVVLAGKGSNGGDGLVAARYLAGHGIPVTALLIGSESEYAGEAQRTLSFDGERRVMKLAAEAIEAGAD